MDLLFGIDNVFPQDLLGNGFNPVRVGKIDLSGVPIHSLLVTWVVLDMAANNEPGKHFILQESSGHADTEANLQLSTPPGAPQAPTDSTACTCTGSTVSLTTHRMSKRETMGSVRSTFSEKVNDGSYRPPGTQRQPESHTGSKDEALKQAQTPSTLLETACSISAPAWRNQAEGGEAVPQLSWLMLEA